MLLIDRYFKFKTSYSLDECESLLRSRSTRIKDGYIWRGVGVVVAGNKNSDNMRHFKLDRDFGRALYAEVHGTLHKINETEVQLSGYGRVYPLTFIMCGMPLLIFGGMFLSNIGVEALPLVLLIILPSVFEVSLFINRERLIGNVKHTLQQNPKTAFIHF